MIAFVPMQLAEGFAPLGGRGLAARRWTLTTAINETDLNVKAFYALAIDGWARTCRNFKSSAQERIPACQTRSFLISITTPAFGCCHLQWHVGLSEYAQRARRWRRQRAIIDKLVDHASELDALMMGLKEGYKLAKRFR